MCSPPAPPPLRDISLSLTSLFVVTTLFRSSSLSVGWMIVSSTRPPSSSTSFHLLTSRSLSKLLSIPHPNLFSYFLFSPPITSPLSRSRSRSLSSSRSVSPFLPLPLSIPQSPSMSISRSGSRVFQDGQHPHSHTQNTSVNPTFFSRFEVIIHQSATPSHPTIQIHMIIPLHRHRAYTSII